MNKIVIVIYLIFLNAGFVFGVTKTSTGTGNWNSAGTWSPSGVPSSADDVVIQNGHTVTINTNSAACRSITINSGGTSTIGTGNSLTISSTAGLTVNGIFNINGGNLTLSSSGTTFYIGSSGTLTWNPGTNTAAAATLFTRGTENFASGSTLIIQKWYDYTVPLKDVITGNFGNLTITTKSGPTINTWQMKNTFQSNQVTGALTITNGYVVLDNSNSISNTTIGSIILTNTSSYLDLYNGTHSSSFTVNTSSISITGGELDGFYTSGSGSCTLNVSGNVDITNGGIFKGANGNNGNFTLNVSGNMTLTRSYFYGISSGNGNSAISISGNLTLLKSTGTYSELYGIVNGNGNTSLTISGNYSNQGYFDLIWNSGISGTGNGNGTMNVGGIFSQSDGDFRGIWNITTTSAGSCSITMNRIDFSGGVFMVHYGCNGVTTSSSLTVNGPLNITFSNATDVFRINGVSTLSSINNAITSSLTVNGDISISGNTSADFSTSWSFGAETINTTGNITINGGNNSFQTGSHAMNWTHTGALTLSGGTSVLASGSGNTTLSINGNLVVSGGTHSFKGNQGTANATVSGSANITGGTFNIYKNSSIAANQNIIFNISGDFNHTGGTISFTDNASMSGSTTLNLSGANYTIGGTGSITSTGGTGTYYGTLSFSRSGTIAFSRTANTHSIQQVKQVVQNGCTLSVNSGDIQIASSTTAALDFLTVNNGGTLDLKTSKIFSNAIATNSGLSVNAGGILKTACPNGLYNNNIDAAISNVGNMNFSLDINSIVEYNGTNDQIISGIGIGNATGNQHKYGILNLNFTGTPDVKKLTLNNNNVYIRTQLQLTAGELNLNGNAITIEKGDSNAITRQNGYIKSEEATAGGNAKIVWQNINVGQHEFPFGVNSNAYIPVLFKPTAGTGNTVEISTRATGPDNTPYYGATHVAAVTNLNKNGTNVATTGIIDRWWLIKANNVTADISIAYRASENTTASPINTGTFGLQIWNGSSWSSTTGTGTGATAGIGTVSANAVTGFGPIVLSGISTSLPIELLSFKVRPENKIVNCQWSTAMEKENDFFTIERSGADTTFIEIGRVKGAGNSTYILNYSFVDKNPLEGTSYYRLKQTDFNGEFTYTIPEKVNRNSSQISSNELQILNLGPNPFTDSFTFDAIVSNSGKAQVSIFNQSGQLVYQVGKDLNEGSNQLRFDDIRNLAPGYYIMHVMFDGKKFTGKLIKEAY